MSDKAQTIKDLRNTADVIEKNGLTKHALYDRVAGKDAKDCPVCSIGGINVTTWDHPAGPQPDAYDLPDEEFSVRGSREDGAERALAAHLGIEDIGIPEWNDQPGRTAEEVIGAFRAAADALEAAK